MSSAKDQNQANDHYEEFLREFSRDREKIAAYIYSLLPNSADAEDVFQRCSLLLWRKFGEFDRDRSFLSWACGVAFYEVRNFLRTARRDRLQFNSELIAQLADRRLATLDRSDDRLALLRGCLERLKSSERDLLRHVYDTDQSLANVARATGQALQTIYNRLTRIRRNLTECVQRKLAAEGMPHAG